MSQSIPKGFLSFPPKGGDFLNLLVDTAALAELKGLRGTEYKTNKSGNRYTYAIGFYDAEKIRPARANLCLFSTIRMDGAPGFSKNSKAYEELNEIYRAILAYGAPVVIPEAPKPTVPVFPSPSPNPSSADISLDECFTKVRGGGFGGDAWIAKITGEDSKFTFSRIFCKKCTSSLSGSGKSGFIEFEIPGPGLYQFKGFCVGSTSNNSDWSGFILLREDGRRFLLPQKAAKLYVKKAM